MEQLPKHHFPRGYIRDMILSRLLAEGITGAKETEIRNALPTVWEKIAAFDQSRWSTNHRVLIWAILREAGDGSVDPFQTLYHFSFNGLTPEQRENMFLEGISFLRAEVRNVLGLSN